MKADRAVLIVTISAAAGLSILATGIEIGEKNATANFIETCVALQDEKELISTTRNEAGELFCTYTMNAYGKAKRTRKAT